MKKIGLYILSIVLLIGLIGCGEGSNLLQPGIAQSEKTRDTSPDVPSADLNELVDSNSEFAFDLYQALKEKEGNLFYSPYSISLALAMAYAGARGETETEMADTLNFTLSQEQLHAAFNYLDQILASRGEGAEGTDSEGFRLNIVNATWGQEDYKFLEEFLDVLAVNYGAGLRLLDFINNPEEARITINEWVEEQTEGRIEDLIPPDAIDSLTRLVLTNAIYFNAAWAYPFSEENTADGTFFTVRDEVTIPMMKLTEEFRYADGYGFIAVELPYDGNELSMVILVPDAGDFSILEEQINNELIKNILNDMQMKPINLMMPKFEFDSDFSLVEILRDMGMPSAFGNADFSGITGGRDLVISDVIHKAFVAVDEAGTEAAAATAVVFRESATIDDPIDVSIDHPFIFIIQDIETDTILFVGRVVNPGV